MKSIPIPLLNRRSTSGTDPMHRSGWSLAWWLGGLVGGILLGGPSAQGGQGFDFIETGSAPTVQVIDPSSGGRVLVAWVEKSGSGRSVQLRCYENGFSTSFSQHEIYRITRPIPALKFESTADSEHLLCVTDGVYGAYRTRVLRFDAAFQEVDRVTWASNTRVLPTGRMLGGEGTLFLSSANESGFGRFIDRSTLSVSPWFVIQQARNLDPWEGLEGCYYDCRTYFNPPPRLVTGIDTTIAPGGAVTAVYDFSGIHLKRYRADGTLKQKLQVDGRPFSGSSKLAKTAVAALDDETTLMAWEWDDYQFVGSTLVLRSAAPFFRALLPDGSTTASIRLEPASTRPDIQDTPAVGLRPDGTGAVAWTVRNGQGSTVWLQRLDAGLQPHEEARIVDARSGFDTDQPMLRSDPDGNLFLSWRCSNRGEGSSQIGMLDLGELDRVPANPRIVLNGAAMQIHWSAPPASTVTLWHSPTLSPSEAVPLCVEAGIPGPRMMEHRPDGKAGFYWLTAD